MQFVCERP